uniref:Uncharacterized protein n=1 Tax=Sphaerodactylus townsendi TaxID=933632 RepID=A0ACB8FIM2_9SAUR
MFLMVGSLLVKLVWAGAQCGALGSLASPPSQLDPLLWHAGAVLLLRECWPLPGQEGGQPGKARELGGRALPLPSWVLFCSVLRSHRHRRAGCHLAGMKDYPGRPGSRAGNVRPSYSSSVAPVEEKSPVMPGTWAGAAIGGSATVHLAPWPHRALLLPIRVLFCDMPGPCCRCGSAGRCPAGKEDSLMRPGSQVAGPPMAVVQQRHTLRRGLG